MQGALFFFNDLRVFFVSSFFKVSMQVSLNLPDFLLSM